MRKFLTYLFGVLVLVPCCFMATACSCSDPEEARVMTLDVNPQVELILDKDNKVVTVNALNDEGNHIISIVADSNLAFENLTADDAVELFLQVTKDNGYLVSATNDEDEFTISISGDSDKLEDLVENTAENFLKNAGINLDVDTDDIEKSEIITQVQECMQEYTANELKNMSEAELIELLKSSRQETKDLLTQELKTLYYELRVEEIVQARFEAIQDLLENNQIIGSEIFNTFNSKVTEFNDKLTEFKTSFENQFLSSTSTYNQKMQEFITAKKALLEARLQEGVDATTLSELEGTVAQAELALASAKTSANSIVSILNSAMNTIASTLSTTLQTITTLLGEFNQTTIDTAVNTAKADFKASFATDYAIYIGDNSYWADVQISTGA